MKSIKPLRIMQRSRSRRPFGQMSEGEQTSADPAIKGDGKTRTIAVDSCRSHGSALATVRTGAGSGPLNMRFLRLDCPSAVGSCH
jgi:hypothetical protein